MLNAKDNSLQSFAFSAKYHVQQAFVLLQPALFEIFLVNLSV